MSSQHGNFGFFATNRSAFGRVCLIHWGGEIQNSPYLAVWGRLLRNLRERSTEIMAKSSVHEQKGPSLGAGGWIAGAALGVVLGAAVWFLFYGWNLSNAQMSTSGVIALVLGIVFSMALGAGLMALLFWSNRKGYDR